ncbi:MAG: hypothetical protein Q9166_005511 [cf. Caloplaca sp. 2 TL-2023]
MLPSIAWRPLVVGVTITCLFVYSWFSDIALKLDGPARYEAQEWTQEVVRSDSQILQPIPKKIWQINFNHPRYHKLEKSIRSWKSKNPEYEHTILDEAAGRQFVRKHYSGDPDILNTYLELGSTILRADYLRYLVLAAEGGIYSDLDIDAIKPIDTWLLSDNPTDNVRAMIGIEYDQLNAHEIPKGLYMPMQFCQWSLAFSAHHPLMLSTVKAVTQGLQDLARSHGVSLSELQPSSDEDVLFTTGPVKWSQEVFSYLSRSTEIEVTYQNLTGLEEPRLMGNVMVLPINAFATGLGYAGSKTFDTEATLLRHTFQGSWKEEELKKAEVKER